MHPSGTKLVDDFKTLQKVWAVHAPLYRIGGTGPTKTHEDTCPMSLGLYHSGQDGLLLYPNIHHVQVPTPATGFRWLLNTVDAFPPASSIREEAGRLTRASGKHSGLANGTSHP